MAGKKKLDPAFNFEQSMTELEQLVKEMETGELDLESALKQFEQGVKLSQQCQEALKNAEQKVQVLADAINAETQSEPETDE